MTQTPWTYDSYRKIQQDATVYQNFIIIYFKWSSTCFGRHTAHHQEPKTAQAATSFAYVEDCWVCSCWTTIFLWELYYDVQIDEHQPWTYNLYFLIIKTSPLMLKCVLQLEKSSWHCSKCTKPITQKSSKHVT